MDNGRAYFAKEWRTAQAISLTIPNLVTAAKRELSFLARVNQDQGLTKAGPTLDRAIRRYVSHSPDSMGAFSREVSTRSKSGIYIVWPSCCWKQIIRLELSQNSGIITFSDYHHHTPYRCLFWGSSYQYVQGIVLCFM